MSPVRPHHAMRPVCETMEDRILHSADLAPLLVGDNADGLVLQQSVQTSANDPLARSSEIVFVDLSVPDATILLADLQSQRDAGRAIEIVTISADQDGLALITDTLATRKDITAVHVLAHGSDGVLQLGNTRLDGNSLMARAEAIAAWSGALTADADLLLYGCDIAQTAVGAAFVRDLAMLTGADVAASTDLTGAAALGGNWTLEFATGRIEANSAIAQVTQQQWAGTLAVAFGSESSGGTTSTTTNYSFSHNVNSGSDRLLLVELVIGNGVGATSVDFNGVALTLLAGQDSPTNHLRVEIWYSLAPPVTSGTVNVNLSSASTLVTGATSYSGVNQSVPFGATVTASGNNSDPGVSVTGGTGDMVVDLLGAKQVSSHTIGAGQTQNFVRNQGTGASHLFGISSRETGTGAVLMSHTISSTNTNWAAIGVKLNQQVAATAPVITSNGGGATASISVAENTTAVTTVTATDANLDPITYSISGGADAAKFTINASTGVLAFVTAPNYEVPTDVGADNVYNLIVRASDGSLSNTQAIAVTVTDVLGAPGAATGTLWFTTAGGQTPAAGGSTWNAGQVLQYGDLGDRFDIDGGLTTGTVDLLPGFTAPMPIRGMHYVQNAITIGAGGTPFTLNPGDLLLVLDPGGTSTVTLNTSDSNPSNNIVVDRQDIVVYRPYVAGNYAGGEYFMLLDNGVKSGSTVYNVHALTLVETPTTVGGVLLPAGTFLVAHSSGSLHYNVYSFTASSTGSGGATQTSNTALLLSGSALSSSTSQIQGMHLLSQPTAFNDTVLPSGTLLVAVNGSNSNYAGVAQEKFDILALNVTRTQLNGGTQATAQLLFDGSDLGLTTTAASGNLNGFTVVTGNVSNGSPLVATGEIRVNTTNGNTQETSAEDRGSHRAVAIAANGDHVVVWSSQAQDNAGSWGVYAQRYDASGAAVGGEFLVNVTTANDQRWATVAMDATGRFVVTWTSTNQDGTAASIYARIYNANGTAAGSEFRVNTTTTGSQSNGSIAMDGAGNFVIVWKGNGPGDSDGIFGRRFTAAGAAIDTVEFRVNSDLARAHYDPSVAMNASGAFVVSWDNNLGVYAQRFTSSGVASGAAIQVEAGLTSGNSAIAMAGDGSFGVVWRAGSLSREVYLRLYDSAGTALSAKVQVNQDSTLFDQTEPSIAMDANRNFIVAWEGYGAADSSGVWAQKFNASGSRSGGEFLINITTSNTQHMASLAMIDLNNFVAVWSGNGPGDASGVFMRQYGTANAAPTINAPASIGVFEDTAGSLAGIVFADTDAGTASVVASFGVGSGSLQASSFGGVTVAGSGTGALTLTGSIANINSFIAAGRLTFTTVANATANVTLTISIDDGGNSGSDGPKTAATTSLLTVTAVNDAPAGSSNTITTREDQAYTFLLADFGFSDPNDPVPNGLANVRISSLPTNGSLTLSGVAVALNQFVSAANISAGNLKFTPAPNAGGLAYASFTFRVQDDGGTANGGVDLDPTARTMTVNVTAVNDAPVGTSKSITILEDGVHVLTLADFGFSDAADTPANNFMAVRIGVVPTAGSLRLDGVLLAGGATVSATDIGNGKLVFTPAANGGGNNYASFSFQVQDDGGTANGGADMDPVARTITVHVTPVNDAPVGTNNTVTLLEDGTYVFGVADFGFTDPNDSPANTMTDVLIVAVPTNGTLTLSGATVTANQLISVASLNAGNLRYTPTLNGNGSAFDSFTFRVGDNGGTANGGVRQDTTARTMTMDVTAVNDAPVNTVPPAQVMLSNGTLVFSGGNAIVISDVDAGGAVVQVDLSVSNGTLTLNGTAGLTFLTGDGTSNISMRGTLADIDAALDGLSFQPTTSFVGSVTLNVLTNDLGNTGGGARTDSDNVVVNVSSSNQAPSLSGANDMTATFEDALVDTGTSVADLILGWVNDPDLGALSGIAVINVVNSNGTWQYSVDGGDIWANFGNPAFDNARLLAADSAHRVRFVANANWNGTVSNGLTFRAWDQTTGSSGGTADTSIYDPVGAFSEFSHSASIVVQPVNDAPRGSDRTVSMNEDGNHIFSAADFGFADTLDTPPNNMAGIWISSLPTAGSLMLNLAPVAAGGFVSLADLNGGLLVFTPVADANGLGHATFGFRLQDDGGTANGGADLDPQVRTMTVDVLAVNDAPQGADNTITLREDQAYALTLTDFGFLDARDAPANNLAAIQVTALPLAGSLTNNGLAVLVNDFVSAADILAGRLVFTPGLDANGNTYATFGFRVQDDGGVANGGIDLDPVDRTITFDVLAVNDAPTGSDNTVTLVEDGSHVFTTSDFGFSDPKDALAHLLRNVRIDSLPIAGNLTLNGQAVAVGQFVSASDINAGRLAYAPPANASGSNFASFIFRVQDDGGVANGGIDMDSTDRTITFDVLAVNDAPTGSNNAVTVAEDGSHVFTSAEFGFADPNDAGAHLLANVQIDSLPIAGSLTLNGLAVSAGQLVSVSDIDAGRLVYAPPADGNGNNFASFLFRVQDDGGVANGGINLDTTPRTLTIHVTAVNDAPVASGSASLAAIDEDVILPAGATVGDLFAGNFSDLADADNASQNQLAGVAVTGQLVDVAQGRWQYSLDNGLIWQNITIVSDSGALTLRSSDMLRFLPVANFTGTPNNLTVRLIDNSITVTGGATNVNVTGNGGTSAFSAQTVNLSTAVTDFNDAPTITTPAGGTIGVTEDLASAITGISFNDVDGGITGIFTATFSVASGSLSATSTALVTVSGSSTALILSGTLLNLNLFLTAGGLSYTTAADATANVTLDILIDDGGNTGTDPGLSGTATSESASASVTLVVASVNDAPVVSAGAPIVVIEGTASPLTGIVFSDVDAGTGTVTTSFTVLAGALSASAGFGVGVGGNASTLTLNGSIADINNFIAAGRLMFTTAAGATADVNLAITINDGGNSGAGTALNGFGSRTLQVNALNKAPTVVAPASVNVTEDVPGVISGISFSDPDAGAASVTVRFTVDSGSLRAGPDISLTITGSGTATLTLVGSVGNINNFIAAGKLTFTTATDATANVSLLSFIDDGGNSGVGGARTASASSLITVTPVNDAPVLASAMANRNTFSGNPLLFQLPATHFVDPDAGDELHYSATLANGAALPNWLRFDPLTRTFSGTPADSDTGSLLIRVIARDIAGASAQGQFVVFVSVAPTDTVDTAQTTTSTPPKVEQEPEKPVAAANVPEANTAAAQPVRTVDAELDSSDNLLSSAAGVEIDTNVQIVQPRPTMSFDVATTTPVIQGDAFLAQALTTQFNQLSGSDSSQLFSNDDLLRKLEELRRQMEQPGNNQQIMTASSIALTSGLSIGYVIWLIRGGILVSSMLSALPAWQMIDPLPVLARSDRGPRKEGVDTDEPGGVDALFDDKSAAAPVAPMAPVTTPAVAAAPTQQATEISKKTQEPATP